MNITITKSTNASTSYGDRGMAYHNPGTYNILVDGNLVGTISGQAGNRGSLDTGKRRLPASGSRTCGRSYRPTRWKVVRLASTRCHPQKIAGSCGA